MKKIFTSVAAILASCAIATAQTPANSMLNYQGVCNKKNAQISLTFNVVNAAEEVIYTETQDQLTDSKGLFTVKIGSKDEWVAIDWAQEGLKLQTLVDNDKVSECDLTAVPYAKVAERYVGQEEIESTVQEMATIPVQVTAMQTILNGSEANEEEGIEATDGLIKEVEQVTNLAQSLSEDLYKEGGVVDIVAGLDELGLANVVENLEQMTPMLQTMEERIEANEEALANVTSDVQEMATLPVQVTAMQTILNGSEANEEEGIEGTDGLIKEVEQVTNLAQSLSEDLYKEGGIVDIVAGLDELGLANVVENLDQMTPMLQDMEERIEANEEALANVTSDVQGLQEASRDYAKVDEVNTEIEDIRENLTNLSKFQESFAEEVLVPLQEAIDAVDVTSEVAEIQETLRGKANVDDVADLREYAETNIAALAQFQESFAEEVLVPIQEVLDGQASAIEDVKANVVELSKFQETFNDEVLAPVSEAISANTAAIEDVKANVVELSKFQETFNDEILTPIQEALTDADTKDEVLKAKINEVIKSLQQITDAIKALNSTVGDGINIPATME